jgi:hypothetical protein
MGKARGARNLSRHTGCPGGLAQEHCDTGNLIKVSRNSSEGTSTGHRPGWIPADGNPAAKWHLDAFKNTGSLPDGTYEACGPQLQSNPYRFPRNLLIRHGADPLVKLLFSTDPATAYGQIRDFLAAYRHQHPEMPEPMPIEGIVWHHDDGRMVKVLASDLGVAWKAKGRS